MKKQRPMRAEYRRENLGAGVRGKHYAEFVKGGYPVLHTPASVARMKAKGRNPGNRFP